MKWISPIRLRLVPTIDSFSYKTMAVGTTGLPLLPHPGAFGAKRKNHTHEGIDLYCPENTPVFAVNSGVIVGIVDFTGEKANSLWWEDTKAVLIHTENGVVVYGEIEPNEYLSIGQDISQGYYIGRVKRVLKVDKGRPMSMLHLELYQSHPLPGFSHHPLVDWGVDQEKPINLLDPTPFLIDIFNEKI